MLTDEQLHAAHHLQPLYYWLHEIIAHMYDKRDILLKEDRVLYTSENLFMYFKDACHKLLSERTLNSFIMSSAIHAPT